MAKKLKKKELTIIAATAVIGSFTLMPNTHSYLITSDLLNSGYSSPEKIEEEGLDLKYVADLRGHTPSKLYIEIDEFLMNTFGWPGQKIALWKYKSQGDGE